MTVVGRLIGFVVLCFLVGLVLKTLGITPRGILTDTWGTIFSVYRLIVDFARWAIPYTLLGAVIVAPLALIAFAQRFGRRR